jgi:hypothetical protein
MGNLNMDNKEAGLTRRKILSWFGLGAIATICFNGLPFKAFRMFLFKNANKRLVGREGKVSISLNKTAVKRSKKVTANV